MASRVIYIKLGRGGKWERECIEERQTIRLGYGECPHEDCLARRWDAVKEGLVRQGHAKGIATQHVEHVRRFYEAERDTVWITFYKNKLWWCRAERDVVVVVGKDEDPGDSPMKERRVLGTWTCEDLDGRVLDFTRLSGKLLTLRSHRWTTAELLPELAEYAVLKINGGVPQSAQAATGARKALVDATADAIRSLHWRDFEILVDLLFSRAGWHRTSEVGGVQKDIDLDLEMPITDERCAVQVKSSIGGSDLMKGIESLAALEGYKHKYVVVHSPEGKIPESATKMGVKIIQANGLAEWCVGLGLVDWVVNKAC